MAFFNKIKIGSTVVLFPTDNAVSKFTGAGSAFDQAQEVSIISIAKVNLSVSFKNSRTTEKFSFHETPYPRLSNTANFGYMVFGSWDEFHDYRIGVEVKKRLMEAVQGHGREHKVTDAQYKKIAEVLGWNELLEPQKKDTVSS